MMLWVSAVTIVVALLHLVASDGPPRWLSLVAAVLAVASLVQQQRDLEREMRRVAGHGDTVRAQAAGTSVVRVTEQSAHEARTDPVGLAAAAYRHRMTILGSGVDEPVVFDEE